MDVFCTVIDIISVCGSIPIKIPILWPRAVMVGPRPRVLLTLPLVIPIFQVSINRKQNTSLTLINCVPLLGLLYQLNEIMVPNVKKLK